MSDQPMTGPRTTPGTPPSKGGPPARRGRSSLLAKENRRLLLGLVIGALAAVFAVLNLDEVDVNWVLGTWETPLIVVIAVSFALGAGAGWAASAVRRRRS